MSKIYILSPKPYKGAVNLPCIIYEYMDKKIDLLSYDALIFSSKNGVIAIDKIDKRWRDIPSYVIGSGTKEMLLKLGGRLVYSAKNSYGDSFALEIKERLKGVKTLFLRAKVVTSSLNTILKESGVLLHEEVVYETKCNECKALDAIEPNSIIIFSSPSTIECFFRCFEWDESFKAVVIGKVTASYMPKGIDFKVSNEQSIPSCITKAKELI